MEDNYSRFNAKGIKRHYQELNRQRWVEEGRKAGIREVVERYKKDNPSMYRKYQAYWTHLEKEWGLSDETDRNTKG